MKKIIAFLCFFMLISLFSVSSFAVSDGTDYVYDHANILSSGDINSLGLSLKSASIEYGVKIFLVTTDTVGGYYYGNTGWYLSHFGENRYSVDAVVLILNLDPYTNVYNYYLDTFGAADADITDIEVDRILDAPEVYDNLKSGNIKKGVEAFITCAGVAASGKLKAPLGKYILISGIIALIPALAVFITVKVKYKRKLKAPIYPLEKYATLSINPLMREDEFMGRRVTRTKIRSSSGGGRSGGRSGGGRTRGGR